MAAKGDANRAGVLVASWFVFCGLGLSVGWIIFGLHTTPAGCSVSVPASHPLIDARLFGKCDIVIRGGE